MGLTFLMVIKDLLKQRQIFPSKRLGQNFLIDRKVLKKIIETAHLQPKDVVLEIGPGIGNITQELAKRAKKVIVIEKDPKMIRILNNELKIMEIKNVEIIQGDILKILNSKFIIHNSYKVVANLPFYIASPVIRKFLEIENPPKLIILMVQKEVAQRICSNPPNMNLLAVSVQFYAEPKIISFVSKKSFWPEPKVDSSIIRITPRRPAPYPPPFLRKGRGATGFREQFFRVIKAGFSQPRKQLVNNLSEELALNSSNGLKLDKEKVKSWLLKNNIQPNQRAETLSLKNWISLTKSFNFLLK